MGEGGDVGERGGLIMFWGRSRGVGPLNVGLPPCYLNAVGLSCLCGEKKEENIGKYQVTASPRIQCDWKSAVKTS